MRVTSELVLVFLLLVANGVLAMAEIALVSARRVRLRQRAQAGDAGARAALELAQEPTRFLSTVQIGITLVGIFAGAFGGATLAEEIAGWLMGMGMSEAYGEAIGLGMVVVAITYLSLIVGELVPKQLGLNAPEAVISRLSRPLRTLSRIAAPVVWLLDASTRIVLRLLGSRPSKEPPITEEELKSLLEQGRRAGVFDPAEQEMMERVLRLGDMRVGQLITPRLQMVMLDLEAPPEASWAKIAESGHSHFPVSEGGPDRIAGVVSVNDLWAQVVSRGTPDLRSALREPLFLPGTLLALKALEAFRKSGWSVALVLDEYGGIDGLVTLHDVLQAIVGELPEAESLERMVTERGDGSWLVDGMLPMGELEALLRVPAVEAEDLEKYQTLGGFLMGRLGRIPEEGDAVEWGDWRFEVVDMDRRRVDKVLVTWGNAVPFAPE